MTLTAADDRRLRSWLPKIIPLLDPALDISRETDNEVRFGANLALAITLAPFAWRLFSSDAGGISALHLIETLGETKAWCAQFLDNPEHAGLGPWAESYDLSDRDDDSDVSALRSFALSKTAADLLGRAEGIIGSAAERYLKSRGIALSDPPPADLGFVRYGRTGESAVIAKLREHGREVAIHVVHLDYAGDKSPIEPKKQTYNIGGAAPGALFEAYPGAPGVKDLVIDADLVLTEGIENALAIVHTGRHVRVCGMAGVWRLRHVPVVKGQKIVLFRDGKDKPEAPATKLTTTGIDRLLLGGAEVRVTETPAGEDANSILQEHGVAAVLDLLKSAQPARLSIEGEAARIAKLDKADTDRAIHKLKARAKDEGVGVGTVRQLVKDARRDGQKANDGDRRPGQGRPIAFPDIEAWNEPVDGGELLDALTKTIRKYVVLQRQQADVLALWILFSHSFDCFDSAPKIAVDSPTPRCGKTRLLLLLERLVRRPYLRSGLTAATFVRVIEAACPTVLFDEIDAQIKKSKDMAEALRQFVNAGFDRGAALISLMVPSPEGGYEPRDFSVYAPQVLAGIGRALHATIRDRAITIDMQRKLKTEKVARLRPKDGADLAILARKASRWAEDHAIALAHADPEVPEWINDRAADGWATLFAIAGEAGGRWPNKVMRAAEYLAKDSDAADQGIDIQLLSDIRQIFAENGHPEALSSADMVKHLRSIEDGPWAELKGGWPITQSQLAVVLRPFHISSGSVRVARDKTAKGYKLAQFDRVFARYFSSGGVFPPDSGGTTAQPVENKGFQADLEPAQDPENPPCAGSENSENLSNPAAWAVVPAKSGGNTPPKKKEGTSESESEDFRHFSESEGDPPGNGFDNGNGAEKPNGEAKSSLSLVEERILDVWRKNPKASAKEIALQCACTAKRVEQVIAKCRTAEGSA